MGFDGFPICESCLEGEMTKRPFNAKGRRAQELLELVHSDVCDLMSIQARCGYEYLLPSLMITLDLKHKLNTPIATTGILLPSAKVRNISSSFSFLVS